MMSLKGHFITQDNLGHIYVVDDRQTLLQINDSGMMTHNYRNFILGTPSIVDASNPQKVLCFNKEMHTLTYLSEDLNLIANVQLSDKGFGNILAACMSYDGNVWLFDGESNSLKKVDANFSVLQSSSDFSALVDKRLNPYLLFERNSKVFICDSTQGIFVTDIFGFLQKNIKRKGITWCDSDGKQLYYITGKLLMIYNIETMEERSMVLDVDKPGVFSLFKDRMVVASPNNISVLGIKGSK